MTGAISDEPEPQPAEEDQLVRFFYIKGEQFRVIHADGAIGGPSPSGTGMVINLFTERMPIPREVVYRISETGQLGDEDPMQRACKNGVIRQVEVSVRVDVATARRLHAWLGGRLDELDEKLALQTSDRPSTE